MPELGPQEYPRRARRDVDLAADRRRSARSRRKQVTDRGARAGLVATGYIECRAGATALANTKGLFAYRLERRRRRMTATVRTPDGTGSGGPCSDGDTFADIDAAARRRTARRQGARRRKPVAIEPGRYTVVLEPTAVGNLVQLIAGAMQARSADEGRSFFSKPGGGNKIGMKVVDERVTIVSDPDAIPSTDARVRRRRTAARRRSCGSKTAS